MKSIQSQGGIARAAKLTAKRRSEISRNAANSRWKDHEVKKRPSRREFSMTEMRAKVWSSAFAGYSQSENSFDRQFAQQAADFALKLFDERFPT